MKRFKKILFVHSQVEGVERSFERAVELARRNGAALTVVTAVRAVASELGLSEAGPPPEKLMRMMVEDRTEEAERLAGGAAEGLGIKTRVLLGTRFVEIIREVIREGHDLLMKPAEGGGGMKDLLFGSVDMHLLRKCPCPVWIMKPGEHKKYRSILAAVDPDPAEEEAYELNYKIMDLATSLARTEGSRLHVGHAWRMISEHILRVRGGMTDNEVNMMAADTREAHKKRLQGLLAKYDLEGIDLKEHIVRGEPAEVITELAKMNKVDLVVMGTVARTGMPGFIIGNTAESILDAVDCSVLAVKPDDFVSPVQP